MDFKLTSIRNLICNNKELLQEYFDAGSNLIKSYNVNKDLYIKMEDAGLLDTLIAKTEYKVVGFIVVSTAINPNYGSVNSTVMAIFVSKDYRKYGTAKTMIDMIENIVKARGSELITISSPANSLFNKYLPKIGYKHINNFYGKTL